MEPIYDAQAKVPGKGWTVYAHCKTPLTKTLKLTTAKTITNMTKKTTKTLTTVTTNAPPC